MTWSDDNAVATSRPMDALDRLIADAARDYHRPPADRAARRDVGGDRRRPPGRGAGGPRGRHAGADRRALARRCAHRA